MAEEYIIKPGGISSVENSEVRITRNTVILVTLSPPESRAYITAWSLKDACAEPRPEYKQRQWGIKAYEHPKGR